MENHKVKDFSDVVGITLILIGIGVAFFPLLLALTVDPDAMFLIFNTFGKGLLIMMSGVLLMAVTSYLRANKEKK